MENKRIFGLTSDFLVNAGQLAYVEDAPGTLNLLENLNHVFRYITSSPGSVSLTDEIAVLQKYILLYKSRFGERFNITVPNLPEFKVVYINHLQVIDFVDEILTGIFDHYDENITIILTFYLISKDKWNMRLTIANDGRFFEKEL